MKNVITVKTSLLILAVFTTFALFFFKLSIERAEKKAQEIDRIESHTYERTDCLQYALVVAKNAWFPCYNCGTADSIYLQR